MYIPKGMKAGSDKPETQKEKIARLTRELSYVKSQREKESADSVQTIQDLNDKLAAADLENRSLKDSIALKDADIKVLRATLAALESVLYKRPAVTG